MTSDVEGDCRTVYAETRAFYELNKARLGGCGFKVLYGPPLVRAPILFIGYQPGGDVEDGRAEEASGAHEWWPDVCEYATADWRLAKNLRSMLGTDLLRRSTGMNAIFFRSPSADVYRKTVHKGLRQEAQQFCKDRVERLISVLDPQKIVVIGFDALRLFTSGTVGLSNSAGRVLTMHGEIAGIPTVASLHLSGAQIASSDRAAIAADILA